MVSLLRGATAEAGKREEAEETESDASDDVPGCGLGESAGEGVADLINHRVGRIHADDEENQANYQENNSGNALRVHGSAFYIEEGDID